MVDAVSDITWFHQIDLGSCVTPGVDRSAAKLSTLKLPDSMKGLTVLDVGAWDGFFSFECERRGAVVTACDHFIWSHPDYGKRGFELARKILKSKVSDITIQVEQLSPESAGGTYDVVLFLGVLYHAPDPLGYLRRIRSVTKGLAVIETHVDLVDIKTPAIAYYPGSTLNRDPTNFFGPNEAAVVGMCQDAGFSRIETISHRDGRMVFHAHA